MSVEVASMGTGREPRAKSRPSISELQGKTTDEIPGRIKVFSSQALKDILRGSTNDTRSTSAWSSVAPTRGASVPASSTRQSITGRLGPASRDAGSMGRTREDILTEKRQKKQAQFNQQAAKYARERQKIVEQALLRRDQEFDTLYSKLLHEKATIVQEVSELLDVKQQASDQRKQMLYRHWQEKIFNPIQDQIAARVDSETIEELEKRKNREFDKFLRASNQRDLFRDIIIPSEYDPLAVRKHTVRYQSRNLEDPLKQDLDRNKKERQQSGEIVDDVVHDMSQRTLDVKMWSKLESTPYYDWSEKAQSSSKRGGVSESKVVLDHYNVARDRDAVKAEQPRGKRVFPDWKPGQTVHEM